MRQSPLTICILLLTMTEQSTCPPDDLMFDSTPPGPGLGWIDSRPSHWPDIDAKHSGGPSAAELIAMYRNRTLNLITLWTNIDRTGCRSSYLSVFSAILLSLMNAERTTSSANRYGQMLCYHLQIIVATLDVRSGVRQLQKNGGRPPPKWLRKILNGMDPTWLHHLLHDTSAFISDITSTCNPSHGKDNGTIIYSMWSPEDTYIGKANVCRIKNGRCLAGATIREMEHWESLILPLNRYYGRPRYKAFRRHAWSDLRYLPLKLVPNSSMGRQVETYVLRCLDPSANRLIVRRATFRQNLQ